MTILTEMAEMTESMLARIMRVLKAHINDYCDLETTEGNAFVAKDGSMGTMLKYHGFKSLVGRDEYKSFSQEVTHGLEPFMRARGHQMQVVYMRDDDPAQKIDMVLRAGYESCQKVGLALEDILDEKAAVTAHHCMDEEVYIILWTRPAILDPMEHRLSKEESNSIRQQYKIPPMAEAQNVLRPNRFLTDRHEAFVSKFVNQVQQLNGSVEVIDIHDAIREMKSYLYKSTPITWKPILPGDPMIGRWKITRNSDMSAALYPRIDDQIFTSPAHVGVTSTTRNGETTDTRAIRIGPRLYAPVLIKVPQQRAVSFTSLFATLNDTATKDSSGRARRIPWSISFLIEGDGLNGISLKKIVAGILAWTSSHNRNLVRAAQALTNYKLNENGSVVKLQISAVTWADYGQEAELMQRRTKLSSALQGWGNCSSEEETGDATEALLSCVPGLRLKSPATTAAAPLDWATYMLPLSRPAPPFRRGGTLFRTLDGKIMPWEMFSDQQSTWITALFGGPGSGKSVLANRLNTEMCILPGLTRLPYIGVVDIGISSSGFITLLQDSLPESKKHLALYTRLQNTKDYRINQFDTQLGQRYPLPREREMMKNFLVRLATPPDRGQPHPYMSEFAGRIIDNVFRLCADDHERSSPNTFAINVNEHIRKAVISAGIDYNEATKWWDIVDAFFDLGMVHEASIAQRYAQPILRNFIAMASDQSIQKAFEAGNDSSGTNVAAEFILMLSTASNDYPIFNGETVFDIGEARVMAFDLQDVVTTGSASARKQSSLMYMVAMNAFLKKISIIEEDLVLINKKYQSHHARRVAELAEDYKRLFIDEYHKTGADETLRESFLIFGRESRKWLLEIVLASQLPQDFAELAQIATTIMIMDSGNEKTRGKIAEIFGLTPTEVAALKRYVNGAIPGVGATFLAKIKTKDRELSQLFTSTSGGLELWGLSTSPEDRALRNALYKRMPSVDARRVLKQRFPSGSCRSYVLQMKQFAKATEGFVDDEKMQSLLEALADELTVTWRTQMSDSVAVV